MLDRRTLIGAGLAGLAIRAKGAAPGLLLYSPAPEGNPMHALNQAFAEGLTGVLPEPAGIVAMALPQSVHMLAPMRAIERGRRWPIMTSVDFLPARLGAGPGWHGYPRACPDLYFVAALYDVGFGISVWGPSIRTPAHLVGRRVGVPARPSAVRLLAEALIADGWDLGDQVELVDMPAAAVGAAIRAGRIDATAWNLMVPGGAGLLAGALPPGARFLLVTPEVLGRIHARQAFRLRLTTGFGPPLLSFAQGLAAWEESDAETIGDVLDYLARGDGPPGFPPSAATMRDWPALDEAAIHPAALVWYRRRGSA